MKAIVAPKPGGPEAMVLVEEPTPEPAAGQALVRVEAAGVNYIDVYHRTGLYKAPEPIRLGLEGAGTVERVGPDTDGIAPGDRVAWAAASGSYATHVLVAAERLVPVPRGVTTTVAAAAMLQGMTAHYLTESTYALGPGDTCLVHAAAGGVGLLLCQMAKRRGARVIGTVSTEEKAALARAAGADDLILYRDVDFAAETRRLTGGAGVSVVYDSVGKSTFEKSLNCLARRGTLVLYGQSSGPVGPFDPQILAAKGSLFLTRPSLVDYTATRQELIARATAVFGAINRGELDVRIHAELPLERAPDAHRMLEGRETVGKVLLIPPAT